MVNMQMLRAKLKVLDVSYGTGTGTLALLSFHCSNGKTYAVIVHTFLVKLKNIIPYIYTFCVLDFAYLHGLLCWVLVGG